MHIFFICPLISYCRFIYDVFLGVFLCVLGCFWVFLGKSMDRIPGAHWSGTSALLEKKNLTPEKQIFLQRTAITTRYHKLYTIFFFRSIKIILILMQ